MAGKRGGSGPRPQPLPPRSRALRGARALGTAAFTTAAFILGLWVGGVLAADGVHAVVVGALSASGAFLLVQALLSRPGPANPS
jgi:hypothetical protein